MSQRSLKIIVVMLGIILPLCITAQKVIQQHYTIKDRLGRNNKPINEGYFGFFSENSKSWRNAGHLETGTNMGGRYALTNLPAYSNSGNNKMFILPGHYYTQSLGFFCRQELKFEQTTSLPLRFRLGSIDYVNYLEQKPNAVFRR